MPIEHDTGFINCPFCDTALYLDTDRTVKHFYLDFQVSSKDLAPVIQRKLSYMEVKAPVKVLSHSMVFLPVWKLEAATGETVLVPGAALSMEAMEELRLPAGDLKLMGPDAAADKELTEPELLLEDAARKARETLGGEDVKIRAASLVHLPFYRVEYSCRDESFEAAVDGVSGEVYADSWPSAPHRQKDRVLGMIAALAFGLFFIEAAAIPGFWLVVPAYAITGVGIYFLARGVLKKMGW